MKLFGIPEALMAQPEVKGLSIDDPYSKKREAFVVTAPSAVPPFRN
jgi:hypothetical protein